MNTVYLVANGDLRLSANQKCEPAQAAMEKALVGAIEREGFNVKRAHLFDETKGHGFIDSQKMGLEVYKSIPQDAPLVVAELYELVGQLVASEDITVVLVEQFAQTALTVADQVAVMVNGRIVRRGTPAEVGDDLMSAYMGSTEG